MALTDVAQLPELAETGLVSPPRAAVSCESAGSRASGRAHGQRVVQPAPRPGLLARHGAHVDRFFYCPYHPEGTVTEFARPSNDRKPMPGMARAAAQALNLDLTSSWVVGDRPEDVGLADAVGASSIYIGSETCPRPGVWSYPNLSLAVGFILERMMA